MGVCSLVVCSHAMQLKAMLFMSERAYAAQALSDIVSMSLVRADSTY